MRAESFVLLGRYLITKQWAVFHQTLVIDVAEGTDELNIGERYSEVQYLSELLLRQGIHIDAWTSKYHLVLHYFSSYIFV